MTLRLEPEYENSLDCWAVSNASLKAENDLQGGFMITETQAVSFLWHLPANGKSHFYHLVHRKQR